MGAPGGLYASYHNSVNDQMYLLSSLTSRLSISQQKTCEKHAVQQKFCVETKKSEP